MALLASWPRALLPENPDTSDLHDLPIHTRASLIRVVVARGRSSVLDADPDQLPSAGAVGHGAVRPDRGGDVHPVDLGNALAARQGRHATEVATARAVLDALAGIVPALALVDVGRALLGGAIDQGLAQVRRAVVLVARPRSDIGTAVVSL